MTLASAGVVSAADGAEVFTEPRRGFDRSNGQTKADRQQADEAMKFGKMKPQRRNRLVVVGLVVVSAGVAVTLALSALNENLNLYYSPAQIKNGEAPTETVIRAGGMVVNNSVQRSTTDLQVNFVVSDMHESEVTIVYEGILPDLFREGQGIVARGQLNEQGVFFAEEVLAKHDETYMPPEVAQTLAQSRAAADAQVQGSTL